MKKILLLKNKLFAVALICSIPVFLNCTCKHCCKKNAAKTNAMVVADSSKHRIMPEPGVQNPQSLDSLKAAKMRLKLKQLENQK